MLAIMTNYNLAINIRATLSGIYRVGRGTVSVVICSPNTIVEKKHSQQKRPCLKVLSFHLYFFARKKNELEF